MKKYISKLMLATLALLVSVVGLGTYNAAGSATKQSSSKVEVKGSSDTATYYDTLAEALSAAKTGDTVKLLASVTESAYFQKAGASITIDLNGKEITSGTGEYTLMLYSSNAFKKSTVKIIDSSEEQTGKITNTAGKPALMVRRSNVTVEGGTISQSNGNTQGAVEIADTLSSTFTLKGNAKITGDNGIVVEGNHTVNIEGGEIDVKDFAIAGVGTDTRSPKINVKAGKLNSQTLAAIYQPEAGVTTVTGGQISGKVGIVARQGEVNIEGGIISATGEGSIKIQTNQELPAGTAVVIDNKTTGYEGKAKSNITGGTFEASADESIASIDDSAEDFDVSGGTYTAPFNKDFVVEGEKEVSVTNGDDVTTWYIGKQADTAIKNASKNGENTIEVIQGDVEITGAAEGLTVVNSGEGTVTVNGEDVIDEIIVELPEEPEKDDSPKTGVVDYTAIATLFMVLSMAGIVSLKKRFN